MSKPRLRMLMECIRMHDERNGVTKLNIVYGLGELRFRIYYEDSNGTPLGFDYKHCLSIMKDGAWVHLEDYKSLAPDMYKVSGTGDNNYFKNQLPTAAYFEKKCLEYINKVYA